MKRSNLIVFTGIDGSGKTTQAKILVDYLKEDGQAVSYVWSRWEPLLLRPFIKKWKKKTVKDASSPSGDPNEFLNKKQALLRNPFVRWIWLGAFFIDYGLQIFTKIRVRLIKGGLVISDRIFFDSVVDQAVNLGGKKDWLLESLDSFWMKIIFPQPDMVFYIDCPETIAFSRKDDAPNIEYLIDRRRLYLQLADRYGWIKMNGTLPVDDLAVKIKDNIHRRFNI
jgi:thymidylate kinase